MDRPSAVNPEIAMPKIKTKKKDRCLISEEKVLEKGGEGKHKKEKKEKNKTDVAIDGDELLLEGS